MQTATGAMAKPPNPEDLKFKTAVDGYVHLHPGSVTAKVVRYCLFSISKNHHSKNKSGKMLKYELKMTMMMAMMTMHI